MTQTYWCDEHDQSILRCPCPLPAEWRVESDRSEWQQCDHRGHRGYADGRQHSHSGPGLLPVSGRTRICDRCGADFCQHCAEYSERNRSLGRRWDPDI